MSEQISSLNLSMSKMHLRYCNGCYLWHFNDFKNKINAMRNDPHIMHYSPGFYTSTFGYRFVAPPNSQGQICQPSCFFIMFLKLCHQYCSR
jgi:hypothetical protein